MNFHPYDSAPDRTPGEDQWDINGRQGMYESGDPWNHPPRRKPRRVGSWLIILGVLALVAAAFSFGLSMSAPWVPESPEPQYPEREYVIEDRQEIPSGTDGIERAEVGTGVVLRLQESGRERLSFQEIYKEALPSVVGVSAGTRYGRSAGTGIIMTEDGYIITNFHVVSGASSVEITLEDERVFSALWVGGDEQSDLAVLKINALGLYPARFGHSDQMEVGDQVVAIGNPLGIELRGTMTDGIISAINRDLRVEGKRMTLIQTNAALNAGNSGGPLINMYGQVVGINIAKLSSYPTPNSTSIEGLGFAIPVSNAKLIVDELIERGHVTGRTAIGITGYGISEENAAFYGTVAGVYVESVDRRSDAYVKRLFPGDIIVEANGRPVAGLNDLENAKNELAVGDRLSLRVFRDGEYWEMEIILMDKNTFSQ